MIKYSDVTTNPELQEAATAYEQAFGGRFVGDEPGPGLVYLDANGTAWPLRARRRPRTARQMSRRATIPPAPKRPPRAASASPTPTNSQKGRLNYA